jgi:RNA polymerase sigma factor (sigma-70 family)
LSKSFLYSKVQKSAEEFRVEDSASLLTKLFTRYSSLVYGVCLKYLKDREEAKDAVMSIFEKLPEKIKKQEIENFKAWLYVITRNHCLMQLRSQKGKLKQEISPFLVETNTELHLEDEPDLEGNLGKLERCMQQLNIEQKTCVQLFFLDEKCYQEVCDTTGYELKKVKSYIQNGKRNLKICMERNE